MSARTIAAGLALLVCVFFGLAVRQATSANAVRDRLSTTRQSPGAARRTATLLDHAAFLQPGTEVDLLRAQFALQQRQVDTAHRLLRSVTAREPANVQAWVIAALTFEGSDSAFVVRALAAIERYAPSVPLP